MYPQKPQSRFPNDHQYPYDRNLLPKNFLQRPENDSVSSVFFELLDPRLDPRKPGADKGPLLNTLVTEVATSILFYSSSPLQRKKTNENVGYLCTLLNICLTMDPYTRDLYKLYLDDKTWNQVVPKIQRVATDLVSLSQLNPTDEYLKNNATCLTNQCVTLEGKYLNPSTRKPGRAATPFASPEKMPWPAPKQGTRLPLPPTLEHRDLSARRRKGPRLPLIKP